MQESDDILAYASVLQLSRSDVKALRIRDAYALHKVVYGLFDDRRDADAKASGASSGILYADQGGDAMVRSVLLLSDRRPHQTPQFGVVQTITISRDFLSHGHYAFSVVINPTRRSARTGKVEPVKGRQEIMAWFAASASRSWGFDVNMDHLQVDRMGVQTFEKGGATVTHGYAKLRGDMVVTDRAMFTRSFTQGIGRGRAFGFGLLKIATMV